MDYLQAFHNYLLALKDQPSAATVKNYRADVGKFIRWFETTAERAFDPTKITSETINVYKKHTISSEGLGVSERSSERYLSSLRKFFNFLKTEDIITYDPFVHKKEEAIKQEKQKDPWHIREFHNYLYVLKSSDLTIKNYIIDVRQFMEWAEKVTGVHEAWEIHDKNVFHKLTSNLIEEYKHRLLYQAQIAPVSVNRKLSSLRKYLSWAQTQGLLTKTLVLDMPNVEITQSSLLSSDILPSFQQVMETSAMPEIKKNPNNYSSFPPLRLAQKISKGINNTFDTIVTAPLAAISEEGAVLLRKVKQDSVFVPVDKQTEERQSFGKRLPFTRNVPKVFYAPTKIATTSWPLYKKVLHHVHHSRPKWYNRAQGSPAFAYLQFATILIFIMVLSLSGYKTFIQKPALDTRALAALMQGPAKTLIFQGRLTDKDNLPLTQPTLVRFTLYNDNLASGSAKLWEDVQEVRPDTKGYFSIRLGDSQKTSCSRTETGSCGIPQTVFKEQQQLWLGVTIGDNAELYPRQQIPTSDYATTSDSLQGLLPITDSSVTQNTNAILALNSSGTIAIPGERTTTMQTLDAGLQLTGQTLSLKSNPGSNGNVTIIPDGLGIIDLQKPLQNTSESNNLTDSTGTNLATGAVQVDDLFAVLATSSGQSAFTVSQNGTGAIISAYSSGTAKFTVDYTGNSFFAGYIGIGVTKPTVALEVTGTASVSGSLIATSLQAPTGRPLVIGSTGNGPISLKPGTNDPSIFLPTNGTVGIGSPTPSEKLDVAGNITIGKDNVYKINGTDVLNSTTLGSTVTKSSLATVGTLTSGTWRATAIETAYGGLGASVTASSAGELLYSTSLTTYGHLAAGGVGQCLVVDTSGLPSWTSCVLPTSSDTTTITTTSTIAPIFSASSSGTTRFTVANNGNISINTTDESNPITVGTSNTNGNGASLTAGGVWTNGSSKAFKTNFVNLDGKDILDRINQLSITRWNYTIEDSSVTHIGPVAEEFYDTFGVGNDRQHISTIDPAGVALIGIQELSKQLKSIKNDLSVTETGDLQIVDSQGVYVVTKADGSVATTLGAFAEGVIGALKAGYIEAETLTVKGVTQTHALTTDALRVTSANVTIAGDTLSDYVSKIVLDVLSKKPPTSTTVLSPTPELATDLISPLSGTTVTVKPASDAASVTFVVQNASGSAVASIDSSGNASFSGTLTSQDATIAGTLRADRIIASEIEGLEEKLQTIVASQGANQTITNITNIYQAPSSLSSPSATPHPSATPGESIATSQSGNLTTEQQSTEGQSLTQTAQPNGPLDPNLITDFADLASISAQLGYTSLSIDAVKTNFGTFEQGLVALGPTSMTDVSVAGQLAIGGHMVITDNAINTIGTILEIQPLRQGNLSIMAGLIYIDTDGNMRVGGNAAFQKDVAVQGTLTAGFISPLPNQDLVISLPSASSDSSLKIHNASGAAVLAVNQAGDLSASGSGTFTKLNLQLIQDAYALSDREIIATGSAGTALVKGNQPEVTILTPLVTEKSLIYITPAGTPSAGMTPYLIRQKADTSFTVGVSQLTPKDVSFNWLIIN